MCQTDISGLKSLNSFSVMVNFFVQEEYIYSFLYLYKFLKILKQNGRRMVIVIPKAHDGSHSYPTVERNKTLRSYPSQGLTVDKKQTEFNSRCI